MGKSTLTANLAAALAAEGKRVGVLDADVWGYSIPRMLGLGAPAPEGLGRAQDPPARRARHRRSCRSASSSRRTRRSCGAGRCSTRRCTQFLEDVAWGELDYLLIDLPPGTGDVSMTLAQLLPQAQVPDRHHAAAGRAEGRAPLGRDGRQGQARDRRRDREHVRLHHPGRRALPDLRRGRRPAAGRRARRAAARQGAADDAAARAGRRRARRWSSTDPDDPAAQAIRQAARGLIAMSPVELPVHAAPSRRGAQARRRRSRRRHVAADGAEAVLAGVAADAASAA